MLLRLCSKSFRQALAVPEPRTSRCVVAVVLALSRVQIFVTPRTTWYQAPLSMGLLRQEYGSGLPFPSPGDIPDLGIKPKSPALQADSFPSELPIFSIFCSSSSSAFTLFSNPLPYILVRLKFININCVWKLNHLQKWANLWWFIFSFHVSLN